MIEIILPWPNAALSPNSRKHWRAKSPYQQEAHRTAHYETVAVVGDVRDSIYQGAYMPVRLIFCPPNKRARDLDNLGASCKWFLDGIATALNVNDKCFRPVTLDFGAPCKPGKVIVQIGETR